MIEGDVILAQVPQANGQIKTRPAILLRKLPPYQDSLICGLSTQLHHQVIDFDEIVSPGDDDFTSTGLVTTSLIRLGFLSVLPSSSIGGSIGAISTERHRRLLEKLCEYLLK